MSSKTQSADIEQGHWYVRKAQNGSPNFVVVHTVKRGHAGWGGAFGYTEGDPVSEAAAEKLALMYLEDIERAEAGLDVE